MTDRSSTASYIALAALLAASPAIADTAPSWEAAFGKGVVEQPAGDQPRSEQRQLVAPRSVPKGVPRKPAAPNVQTTDALVAQLEAQGRTDAHSLVATFNAALESGATAFSTMRSPQQVVSALAIGVPGSGKFAETSFRVPGLDPSRQGHALKYLRIQQGRIVVIPSAPTPAATTAPTQPADTRSVFAGGRLKVQIPRDFVAEKTPDDDLMLRTDGSTLTIHLEASAPGLDAWQEIRSASETTGKPISMSGKKVYITEPNRHAPTKVSIGFGQTLVSIKVAPDSSEAGSALLRLALPGIISSLAEARK